MNPLIHQGLRTVHGESRRGKHTAEYRTWAHILTRCENPSCEDFGRYGGRGITVCERWHNYELFLSDMGRKPSVSHSIERIDNSLGYSPENCKWATPKEQANNTRRNLRFEFGGEILTLAQWSDRLQINYGTLKKRLLRLKWTTERAFTERPIRRIRHAHHSH